MARNAEKAMTALARWRRAQQEEQHPTIRRPKLTSDCNSVGRAIKFRWDVVREISKKISQIQNPHLGEFKIRDVNDEINKLLREKGHWEVRVKELGGPDFLKQQPKWFDREGRYVPGMISYKYFGAARDLPGVREIIDTPAEAEPTPKKNKTDLLRYVDASYYGYMDDDDGVLVPLEAEEERKAVARAVGDWKSKKEAGISIEGRDEDDIYRVEGVESDDEHTEYTEADAPQDPTVRRDEFGEPKFIAHVSVPSQKEIENAIVDRKKKELLEKYVSEELSELSKTAKTLMGF